MCGIGGFSGGFSPELLTRMNSAMMHRGPDDGGVLALPDEKIGLCHRRLSIIDLSPLGHQPMWDASKKVSIVFNGEIYNFMELREELIKRGYQFTSQSDTEVLLNLYLADGEGMLSRLNGMFAFALWDSQKKRLFVARDSYGIKPFYYSEAESGFIFASELKALLQESSIPKDIDAQAVMNYITYLWCPAPRTMLAAVKKLEPGHAMFIEAGKVTKKWQFYDLPFSGMKTASSPRQAAKALRIHLAESVRRQMVADVPVGAFLSGGLDSSAVVYFAKKYAQKGQLECFTIEFYDDAWRKEGMVEDLPYAKKVAQHLGVELHTIGVGPEMATQFASMVFQLDEPQADPAALNVLFISKLAREHGIKVLLSGSGGDDIFSGYRRHHALILERYWSYLPRIVRLGLRHGTQIFSGVGSTGRRLAKLFNYADKDELERIAAYFNWVDPATRNTLIGSWMRNELAGGVGVNPLLESIRQLNPGMSHLDKMLYLETKYFLADHNLNYTDKMAMAASVEVRVPFLDNDLVAFAASLPDRYRQRYSEGKWLLKKAMEPFLPHEVIYRPKTGFGVPIRSWLKNQLSPMVDDLLSDEVVNKRGLFDAAGVRALVQKNRLGKTDASYTLFSMMCVEMWCRSYLDGQ
jgi:asparagine synthase (glutamine-hydrolysing)